MSLGNIRSLINTALGTIGGLEHSTNVPSVVNPPFAFCALRPTEPVTYDLSAGNHVLVYHMYVEVLVSKGSAIEQAQDELDPYLQSAGSSSIKYTIESIDWATTADCCRVTGISNYGPAMYGGIEFLGARLNVDIWRSS